jgi:hypothetical protein
MKKLFGLVSISSLFVFISLAFFTLAPQTVSAVANCPDVDRISVPTQYITPGAPYTTDYAYRIGYNTGCQRFVQGLNDESGFCGNPSNIPSNFTSDAKQKTAFVYGCRDGYAKGREIVEDSAGGGDTADTDNLGSGNTADTDNLGGGDTAGTGAITTEADIIRLINKIINWMFTIFISCAIIMFIYAAFIYLTSGGGEEVGKAHKMMLYGAIAVAVATLSKGLVSLVQNFVKN